MRQSIIGYKKRLEADAIPATQDVSIGYEQEVVPFNKYTHNNVILGFVSTESKSLCSQILKCLGHSFKAKSKTEGRPEVLQMFLITLQMYGRRMLPWQF